MHYSTDMHVHSLGHSHNLTVNAEVLAGLINALTGAALQVDVDCGEFGCQSDDGSHTMYVLLSILNQQ